MTEVTNLSSHRLVLHRVEAVMYTDMSSRTSNVFLTIVLSSSLNLMFYQIFLSAISCWWDTDFWDHDSRHWHWYQVDRSERKSASATTTTWLLEEKTKARTDEKW